MTINGTDSSLRGHTKYIFDAHVQRVICLLNCNLNIVSLQYRLLLILLFNIDEMIGPRFRDS